MSYVMIWIIISHITEDKLLIRFMLKEIFKICKSVKYFSIDAGPLDFLLPSSLLKIPLKHLAQLLLNDSNVL